MFSKILTWKHRDMDASHEKSKATRPAGSKTAHPKKNGSGHDNEHDWANCSGITWHLTEQQKRYLDRVSKILDQADKDLQ